MLSDVDTLISELEESIRKTEFSGVVSVQCRGDRYERAFGLQDRANRLSNTVTTRFGIASGTKFFTALGIGRLIDRGSLDLTTRLLDAAGVDLPGVSGDVTVDHLLAHTSGVYDYFDEEEIEDFDSFELPIPPFKLRRLRDYLPMLTSGPGKFVPGQRFAYSNGGYILLGLIIEEASGCSYQDFIQQEVFESCGMLESGFFALDQLPERVAQGYVESSGGKVRSNVFTLPIVGGSDGGAYCTAADIARLWREFHAGRVLSPELTRHFQSPFATKEGPSSYGRGLWLCHDESTCRYSYIEGADAGVSFQSAQISHDLGYVLMSNTSGGVWPLARLIRAALMDPARNAG